MGSINDLKHLQNEDGWRHFPVQPMKRNHSNGNLDVGIVVAGVMSVYEINMMDLSNGTLRPQLENVPHTEYSTYGHMVSDGWEVD